MSDIVHSNSSTSFDSSHVSSFDGNGIKTTHSREVSLGVSQNLLKGKYFVTSPKNPNEDLETSVAYNDEDDDDCGDARNGGNLAEKHGAFKGVLNGRSEDIAKF
ncbi:hypothetical protein ACFE04_003652 [Oxalis oulophora]